MDSGRWGSTQQPSHATSFAPIPAVASPASASPAAISALRYGLRPRVLRGSAAPTACSVYRPRPSSGALINLVAAGLLLGAAALPLVALPLWSRPLPRRLLLGIAWAIAVACIGHALIDDVLSGSRSLAGRYGVSYPAEVWISVDRRAADLQDLLFNDTWSCSKGPCGSRSAGRSSGRRGLAAGDRKRGGGHRPGNGRRHPERVWILRDAPSSG